MVDESITQLLLD